MVAMKKFILKNRLLLIIEVSAPSTKHLAFVAADVEYISNLNVQSSPL